MVLANFLLYRSSFIITSERPLVAPSWFCFFFLLLPDSLHPLPPSLPISSETFGIHSSCLFHWHFPILFLHPSLLFISSILIDVYLYPQFSFPSPWSPSQSNPSWVQQSTWFSCSLSSPHCLSNSSGHSTHIQILPFWVSFLQRWRNSSGTVQPLIFTSHF